MFGMEIVRRHSLSKLDLGIQVHSAWCSCKCFCLKTAASSSFLSEPAANSKSWDFDVAFFFFFLRNECGLYIRVNTRKWNVKDKFLV